MKISYCIKSLNLLCISCLQTGQVSLRARVALPAGNPCIKMSQHAVQNGACPHGINAHRASFSSISPKQTLHDTLLFTTWCTRPSPSSFSSLSIFGMPALSLVCWCSSLTSLCSIWLTGMEVGHSLLRNGYRWYH